MRERLRAPLAAAIALLLAGDLAGLGPAALLDAGRWLFPYLWLFLAFEVFGRGRRLLDDEAFLAGAAVALVDQGVRSKALQDGVFFLGVDLVGALIAAFDAGMVAVLALHAADALLPRPPELPAPAPTAEVVERGALIFIAAAVVVGWVVDSSSGRVRVARALGPSWLLADLLFVGAAALLVRRILARAADDEPSPRDAGLWALAAFCAWLPPAQLLGRVGGEWPAPLSVLYVLAWTAAFAVWARASWRERAAMDPVPRRAVRPLLAVALWRVAGAALVAATLGPAAADDRALSAYAFLVDLPVRLAFFTVFFGLRAAV